MAAFFLSNGKGPLKKKRNNGNCKVRVTYEMIFLSSSSLILKSASAVWLAAALEEDELRLSGAKPKKRRKIGQNTEGGFI